MNVFKNLISHLSSGQNRSLTVVMLMGLAWTAVLFYTVYPYPSRWMSDDFQYLLVAENITHAGRPFMNLATELYGGDIQNMTRLGQPSPRYQHVLGYHFPSYSYFLAFFLGSVKNIFWSVSIGHLILFIGIIFMTYRMTLRLTSSSIPAFLAAFGVCFSPTLSMYLPISMMEIFCVFMAMLSCFLVLRPSTAARNCLLALVLSILVLSRMTFFALALPMSILVICTHENRRKMTPYLLLLLPLISFFTLGRNGFLYFHESRHPTTWNDLIWTIEANLSHLLHYKFAFSGHPIYELYLYIGMIIALISLVQFYNNRWVLLIIFGHFAILLGIFCRYDWFDWRHIRVAMWFVPFSYVLAVSLISNLQSNASRIIMCIPLLFLTATGIKTNMTLLCDTLPAERKNAQISFNNARKLLEFINDHYRDAALLAVPQKYMTASLYDLKRTYYTAWPKYIDRSLLFSKKSGLTADVIFLTNRQYQHLVSSPAMKNEAAFWTGIYRQADNTDTGLYVLESKTFHGTTVNSGPKNERKIL